MKGRSKISEIPLQIELDRSKTERWFGSELLKAVNGSVLRIERVRFRLDEVDVDGLRFGVDDEVGDEIKLM